MSIGRWLAVVVLASAPLLLAPVGALADAGSSTCVNPGGTQGCFSTIQAAVNAVAPSGRVQVGSGTYMEDVTISKSVNLQGAGSASTIIDATGKSHGVEVDGAAAVTIQGFTIENASFGGVIFVAASTANFSNNRVVANDKGLVITPSGQTCPGIVSTFPFDNMDCGEGVTIAGLSNSVLSSNVVEGNAGGFLVSDEKAATFGNVIANNTVSNNRFDCGITLAAHQPGHGVYNNVVRDNLSTGNGSSGTGIFTPIPGTAAHDNTVIHNVLTNNGLPGVGMHSHAANQNLNNNSIIGNTISGNGSDPGVTTLRSGVLVFADVSHGAAPILNTTVVQNTISDEDADVWVGTNDTSVNVHANDLLGSGIGVDNAGTGTINARANYWGCATGPNTTGCSSTSGPNVEFVPFLRRLH